MEEAENLYLKVEDKKMLERIKLLINLRQEEDSMSVYTTTNTECLKYKMTCDSRYDNSVTEVVDGVILNQAKEMFRLLKDKEKMKMNQLNVNDCSVDVKKNNSKQVKQFIQLFEYRKGNEKPKHPKVENAMKELESNQKLAKRDSETVRSSTVIALENLSQNRDGHESEVWKRSKTPHNTPSLRRRKARNVEYNNPSKFSSEGFPLNWTNVSELVNNSCKEEGNRYYSIRVILEPGQEEYDSILSEFKLSHVSFKQVERFQSTRKLEDFKFEMDCCRQCRGSEFDFDTKYLYHCTTEEPEKVCNKGLNVTKRGPFGIGFYFSDDPGVCLRQISRQTSKRATHMFRCRVIMGDVKYYGEGEYDETLRREPRKENRDSSQWQYYDSVMGLTEDGLEVVVYEERRILIEYIIHLNNGAVVRLMRSTLIQTLGSQCVTTSI